MKAIQTIFSIISDEISFSQCCFEDGTQTQNLLSLSTNEPSLAGTLNIDHTSFIGSEAECAGRFINAPKIPSIVIQSSTFKALSTSENYPILYAPLSTSLSFTRSRIENVSTTHSSLILVDATVGFPGNESSISDSSARLSMYHFLATEKLTLTTITDILNSDDMGGEKDVASFVNVIGPKDEEFVTVDCQLETDGLEISYGERTQIQFLSLINILNTIFSLSHSDLSFVEVSFTSGSIQSPVITLSDSNLELSDVDISSLQASSLVGVLSNSVVTIKQMTSSVKSPLIVAELGDLDNSQLDLDSMHLTPATTLTHPLLHTTHITELNIKNSELSLFQLSSPLIEASSCRTLTINNTKIHHLSQTSASAFFLFSGVSTVTLLDCEFTDNTIGSSVLFSIDASDLVTLTRTKASNCTVGGEGSIFSFSSSSMQTNTEVQLESCYFSQNTKQTDSDNPTHILSSVQLSLLDVSISNTDMVGLKLDNPLSFIAAECLFESSSATPIHLLCPSGALFCVGEGTVFKDISVSPTILIEQEINGTVTEPKQLKFCLTEENCVEPLVVFKDDFDVFRLNCSKSSESTLLFDSGQLSYHLKTIMFFLDSSNAITVSALNSLIVESAVFSGGNTGSTSLSIATCNSVSVVKCTFQTLGSVGISWLSPPQTATLTVNNSSFLESSLSGLSSPLVEAGQLASITLSDLIIANISSSQDLLQLSSPNYAFSRVGFSNITLSDDVGFFPVPIAFVNDFNPTFAEDAITFDVTPEASFRTKLRGENEYKTAISVGRREGWGNEVIVLVSADVSQQAVVVWKLKSLSSLFSLTEAGIYVFSSFIIRSNAQFASCSDKNAVITFKSVTIDDSTFTSFTHHFLSLSDISSLTLDGCCLIGTDETTDSPNGSKADCTKTRIVLTNCPTVYIVNTKFTSFLVSDSNTTILSLTNTSLQITGSTFSFVDGHQGGCLSSDSDCHIDNVTFTHITSAHSGLFVSHQTTSQARPKVTVKNSKAVGCVGGNYGASAEGVFLWLCGDLDMFDTLFEECSGNHQTIISMTGETTATMLIKNCRFTQPTSESSGTLIRVTKVPHVSIINTTVSGLVGEEDTSVFDGSDLGEVLLDNCTVTEITTLGFQHISILNITAVTIRNCNFTHLSALASSLVISNEQYLIDHHDAEIPLTTIEHCLFTDNVGTYGHAGVYIQSHLHVSHCLFNRSISFYGTDAICVDSYTDILYDVEIVDCQLVGGDSSTDSIGQFIQFYVINSLVLKGEQEDCLVSDFITSSSMGGVVTVSNTYSLLIERVRFSSLRSNGASAIFINNPLGNMVVTNCSFSDCVSEDVCGAVRVRCFRNGASVTIEKCAFQNCEAMTFGGAVYVTAEDEMLSASSSSSSLTLSNESPSEDKCLITSCSFIDCRAVSGGAIAAVWLQSQVHLKLTVENATFCNNSVSSKGGAIFSELQFQDNETLADSFVINTSTFSNNTCQLNVTVEDNPLKNHVCGGGIYTTATENKHSAADDVQGRYHMKVVGSSFVDNMNFAVSTFFSSVQISSSTFKNNTMRFREKYLEMTGGCYTSKLHFENDSIFDSTNMLCNQRCNTDFSVTDTQLRCNVEPPKILNLSVDEVQDSEWPIVPAFIITIHDVVFLKAEVLFTNTSQNPLKTTSPISNFHSAQMNEEESPGYKLSDATFESGSLHVKEVNMANIFDKRPESLFIFISSDSGNTWSTDPVILHIQSKQLPMTTIIVSVSVSVVSVTVVVLIIVLICCVYRRRKLAKEDRWIKLQKYQEMITVPLQVYDEQNDLYLT
ncbi:hypothetical protein BLNAU_2243 [Blattamonas nauphoetae]|uniref:Right handed beta helix domain-containing protein n=1 Tax=Blattamonas nauphoetae TaxID=2049346 RepID=A0ABQ9YGB4_9EUKA|nr:hypothetical protein BLNAU_2243 [Blattamonas nauphoetae]